MTFLYCYLALLLVLSVYPFDIGTEFACISSLCEEYPKKITSHIYINSTLAEESLDNLMQKNQGCQYQELTSNDLNYIFSDSIFNGTLTEIFGIRTKTVAIITVSVKNSSNHTMSIPIRGKSKMRKKTLENVFTPLYIHLNEDEFYLGKLCNKRVLRQANMTTKVGDRVQMMIRFVPRYGSAEIVFHCKDIEKGSCTERNSSVEAPIVLNNQDELASSPPKATQNAVEVSSSSYKRTNNEDDFSNVTPEPKNNQDNVSSSTSKPTQNEVDVSSSSHKRINNEDDFSNSSSLGDEFETLNKHSSRSLEPIGMEVSELSSIHVILACVIIACVIIGALMVYCLRRLYNSSSHVIMSRGLHESREPVYENTSPNTLTYDEPYVKRGIDNVYDSLYEAIELKSVIKLTEGRHAPLYDYPYPQIK